MLERIQSTRAMWFGALLFLWIVLVVGSIVQG